MSHRRRLAELGLTIPPAPTPAANYLPYVRHGDLVYVAGQIAFRAGGLLYPGVLPTSVTLEEGQAAARQCALNLLAAVNEACSGDLDRLERCIRIDAYICSTNDFAQQALVANGASDLLVAVLGEAGRHARTAIGVNVLPLNACVEINGIFAIR